MRKTSAWPLALSYGALILYASLYPFSGWRIQGVVVWSYLFAPFPRFWSAFDVGVNVAGYAPLGFLLAVGALRTGRQAHAVVLATLGAALLSLVMETLQLCIPGRVASNVDLGLNAMGAWLGAMIGLCMDRLGVLDRWSRFKARWFFDDARGALVLLALWPAALLFPAAVPFGLGQVMARIEVVLSEAFANTPFLSWLPARDHELQLLTPGVEMACVAMGLLIPCLLGYSVIRSAGHRVVFFLGLLALGLAATGLSSALSWGPQHAWAWFGLPARTGVVLAAVIGCLGLPLPRRVSAALALVMLGVELGLLNQAPAGPYFAQTLQAWEQGQFIRFHGVAQWIGWLWPFAVIAYLLSQLWRTDARN